jgi:hypothetical protein
VGERVVPQDPPQDVRTVVAQLLQRLYPSNPDVVLGREARLILEAFTAQGLAVVHADVPHGSRLEPLPSSAHRFYEHDETHSRTLFRLLPPVDGDPKP